MKKWSDIWATPKGLLITIIILLCLYGVFNLDKVILFLDTLFLIVLNKILPIVIVVAIIFWVLRSAKGK
jgi:hypothetical protein